MSSGRPEPHTQRRLEPVAAIEEQKLRRRIRKNIRCYVRLGPRLLYRRLWLEGQSVKPQVGATDLAGEGSPAAPSALAQALPPSR